MKTSPSESTAPIDRPILFLSRPHVVRPGSHVVRPQQLTLFEVPPVVPQEYVLQYRLWFKFLHCAAAWGGWTTVPNVKRYRSRAAAEKRLALVSQYEGNILREYRISQVPRRDTL
jgi:hypothetical protein